MADENPFSSDSIDLVTGADQYGLFLLDGLRKGTVNVPAAQNIIIGASLSAVTNMFLRQENRLQRNAEHSAEYSAFLCEYGALAIWLK